MSPFNGWYSWTRLVGKFSWPMAIPNREKALTSFFQENPQILETWFTNVNSFFQKISLIKCRCPVADLASWVWNADEMRSCLGSTSKKVLAGRGAHRVNDTRSPVRQWMHVGMQHFLPLSYIEANAFTLCGHREAQSSGWMEKINDLKWFELQF